MVYLSVNKHNSCQKQNPFHFDDVVLNCSHKFQMLMCVKLKMCVYNLWTKKGADLAYAHIPVRHTGNVKVKNIFSVHCNLV